MIFGDVKYPDIDYAHETGDVAALFFYMTLELFLTQCILQLSRMRQSQRPSVLDYIFIDEENLIDNIQCNTPMGKSDHVGPPVEC